MKKLFLFLTLSIFAIGQMWGASYTFTSGTTIYIDCSNFADQIKIPKTNTNGYEDNKRDGNAVYAVTFTADVTWNTDNTFIKPYPGGSSKSVKFQVPGDGQNSVVVAADGKSFSWSTYNPNQPSVAFNNTFPASIGVGSELEFLATHVSSQNVENPTYTFYVKKGSGSYGSAVSSYTFNEGGTYTVKVEVREEGATGDVLAYAEKTIGCTYTIYFKDNLNWGKVYVHFYPDNQTFSPTNGVGGNAAEINEKMSQIGSTTFYQYTFTPSKDYTKVCFTYSNQNNYNDFYDNKCSWSPSGLDFANGTVLWIPEAGSSESLNNCTYYNTGVWSVYPPVDPSVEISGLSSTLVQGQNVVFAATSENVTNPAYTFYVKQGEGEYGDAVENYTFDAAGSYTVKVEVRANGTGDALATATKNVTVQEGHIFTSGTTIYIDFTQVEGDVNFPYNNQQGYDYDANGGGTVKTITFTNDVTWLTSQTFIKTSTGGWASLKFIVPTGTQNCAVVAADGKSFTWTTYDPSAGYTFTAGTTIYIDFTQVSGGVNFPYNDYQGIDYDENGGGTVKTITFASDVTWQTDQVFIKTATGNWQNRNFIAPEDGQNYITVPADGNSFTWSTYDPSAGYTFTAGTTIYIDFSQVSGGVNFPYNDYQGIDYDENGGGTVKTITFASDVTWQTDQVFIKTATGNWQNRNFIAPSAGQNYITVPADGNSFTWSTYVPTEEYTVYFRNTVNWSDVWIHLYTDDKTFGSNGVGSKKASVNAKMTLVESNYYEYTYQAASPYTKVCFTKEEQNNYDNFHNNECSWSDAGYDAANGLVLWTPDKDQTSNINSCTYYNTGTWTAFAPGQPNVSFVNLSSTIAKGSHVEFEAEALNVTNPTYRFYVKQGEGEYGDAVTSYDFNDEGAYTIKVEVRSNDAGEALAYAEQNVTCAIMYTVYFKNTPGWENVYVHFYADNQTFGNNGVGGQDALLQAEMEQVGTSDIYTYSYTSGVSYTKVCFTKNEQFNYGQFHNNECSWSDAGLNYATNEILWIPNGIISHNVNSCPYYDGKWFVYPYAEAAVAFISLPAEVENGQAINLANYVVSLNVADPAYTFYAKQGSEDYAEIASNYTFPASGTYSVKVEVRENGAAGAALAYDEAEIIVPLIATNFFLAGTFNSWSTEANCFRKATVDAEEATTKITVNEYSNITFKVIENGGWIGADNVTITKDANSLTLGEAGQGDNIHLTPFAAGDYIFTLNLNTRLLTVTYPDGEQMPVPTNLYAAGQFNDWATSSSSYKFTAVGDVATLTLQNLEANHDYEFKLIDNGAWLGANYTIKYHYNWEVPFAQSTSENAVLKTFKAGNYTLTYTISTGLLTVTYPTDGLETKQVEILAQADGYATFYSNKGWDYPSEVEAYYVSGVDDNGSLTMVPLQGYIPAWVPVLLHATPDTYTFYECDDETWIDGNMLKGTIDDQTIDNEHVHYILTLGNGVPGLFWPYGTTAGVGSFENKAGKAYLEVPVNTPVPAQVSARRGFPFVVKTPTDIENIEIPSENGKMIMNGQLFIIRDGKIYNAQGLLMK